MAAPELDRRTIGDIVETAKGLAGEYVPEWQGFEDAGDPGRVVVDLFARLMELLIERENRIPEKNFIRFLDLVGVEQAPGSPATVPVTFLLAKDVSGGEIVPAGSRAATTQTETSDAQVFETTAEFFATPSRVAEVVALAPGVEGYGELSLAPERPPSSEWLEGSNRPLVALDETSTELSSVPHVLYLESSKLFGRDDAVDVTLSFALDSGAPEALHVAHVTWKRFDSELEDWVEVTASDTSSSATLVEIELTQLAGVGEVEVAGSEGFWIAGHLVATAAATLALPRVKQITGQLASSGAPAPVQADFAFANANPLDFSKPVRPFGERAAYGDAFYLGSLTALGPEVESVTLTFSFLPYSNADLVAMFAGIVDPITFDTDVEWEYLGTDGSWKSIGEFRYQVEMAPGPPVTVTARTPSVISGPATLEVEGSAALFPAALSDTVVLRLPLGPDIGLQKVNGEEAYWIRAILRSSEPYGSDGLVIPGTEQTATEFAKPPVFVGPLHFTPSIETLGITFTHRATSIAPTRIVAENNFATADETAANESAAASFLPFVSLPEHTVDGVSGVLASEPAIYVGVDRKIDNRTVSFFVHLDEPTSQTTSPIESGDPRAVLEYWAEDSTWRPLDATDGTNDLTTSGTLEFLYPVDAASLTLFPLLLDEDVRAANSSLFWLRVRLVGGTYDHPPRVLGIYPNTVLAENRTTVAGDLLVGSGNGRRDQKVRLVKTSILAGELWVREPERPSEEELEALRDDILDVLRLEDADAELEPDDLVDRREVEGEEPEIWVRWHRVANFLASGARSRHYTLDRVRGELGFGSGAEGLIPPIGKDNLVLRGFQSGGGEDARKAAAPLAVQKLQTSLPFVSKVFNVTRATGGSNPWSLEDTKRFGPQSIKNRGRAITTEDYEWMILERFGQIGKVRCLPTQAPGPNETLVFQPGAVTALVVPKSDEALPQPSSGLRRLIQEYLQQQTLGCIVADVWVIGPSFVPVSIAATVKATSLREASLVARRVTVALEEWLHPLKGREDEQGWEFGRDVRLSEVFAVIAGIDGVDYVQSATFAGSGGVSSLFVPDNGLAASGTHEIGVI